MQIVNHEEDNTITGRVCQNCWFKTIDFHSFYIVIEKAQKDFALQRSIKSECDNEPEFRLQSDTQFGFDWIQPVAEIKDDFSDNEPSLLRFSTGVKKISFKRGSCVYLFK